MSKKEILKELSNKDPINPEIPILTKIESERILEKPSVFPKHNIREYNRMCVKNHMIDYKTVLILILTGGLLYAIFYRGRFKKDK